MAINYKELSHKIEEIERNVVNHNRQLAVLFEHLKKLLDEKSNREDQASRKRIGF